MDPMTVAYFLGCAISLVIGLVAGYFTRRSKVVHNAGITVQHPTPIINVDLDSVYRAMDQIPNKVLQSITSSSNNQKGKLGELIAWLKLHATYDRIIPLGDIVDFIAIVLPKDGVEGHIDFIDVKTGKAKLSRDQLQLRKLISEKKINFIKLKVETETIDESTTE